MHRTGKPAEWMVNGPQAWRMLALVGLAELLGMAPWFSASAVSSSIVAEYHLTSAQAAWQRPIRSQPPESD